MSDVGCLTVNCQPSTLVESVQLKGGHGFPRIPQVTGARFMSTEVKMPQMGESIYEGTVTKWLKKEGEQIKKDEPLYELSTDKVDTEIPSPVSGTLSKIVVQAGQKVPIHTVVAMVDEGGNGDHVVLGRRLALPPGDPGDTVAGDGVVRVTVAEAPVAGPNGLLRLVLRDAQRRPAALGTYLGTYGHVTGFHAETGAMVELG